jgi:hypothetical protein
MFQCKKHNCSTELDDCCRNFAVPGKSSVNMFQKITVSPETLATTYVFKVWDTFSEMFCWRSLLVKEDVKFASQSEAVKATIDVLCGE